MTFSNFQSFVEWCENVEEINTETEQDLNDNQIVINNLYDTNGMLVCEILVSAYDSGFIFGPMHSEMENGSILIYDE